MFFLTIKPATLSGIGIYRIVESGQEVNVWKFRTLVGKIVYENSDGKRFSDVNALMKEKA